MATFKKEPPSLEAASETIKQMAEDYLKKNIKVTTKRDEADQGIVVEITLGEKLSASSVILDSTWSSETGWDEAYAVIRKLLA